MTRALPALLDREDIWIYHATGHPQGAYDPEDDLRKLRVDNRYRDALQKRYHREPYFDHIERCYRIADLVVGRSGAGSVWEIAAVGVPAILIPKPGLPGDHQVKNARFLERHGQARVIYEQPHPAESGVMGPSVVDAEEFVREALTILDREADSEVSLNVKIEAPDGAESFREVLQHLYHGRPLSDLRERFPRQIESDGVGGNGEPAQHLEWLSPSRLLAVLDGMRRREDPLGETDCRYLKSRINRLLASPQWQSRNLGVKLAGVTLDQDCVPMLVHFITDRTPASRLDRLMGGDFQQVGFIRRNALQALWRLRAYDAASRDAILQAMDDPYFEVRSWAARAVSRMADLIGEDEELEGRLRRNLQDRRFEVVTFSLEPLGMVCSDPGILDDLVPLLENSNWKVQEAAVQCLTRLLQRGVMELPRETEEDIKKIPMRGLDFTPRFSLQKTWETFLYLRHQQAGPNRKKTRSDQ